MREEKEQKDNAREDRREGKGKKNNSRSRKWRSKQQRDGRVGRKHDITIGRSYFGFYF